MKLASNCRASPTAAASTAATRATGKASVHCTETKGQCTLSLALSSISYKEQSYSVLLAGEEKKATLITNDHFSLWV